MKIITNILQIDRQQWEELVATSPTATWFQTAEAYELYASLPEIFSPFIVACDNDGLKGIIIGYVTQEKNAIKQFFTSRAIIIGGPLLAEDITDEELTTLLTVVRKHIGSKAIYIESRNFNDYSRWRGVFERCGFAYQPHLNFHIDTSSVERMEANLHKSRKRDIRVSMREGAELVLQPTIEQVREYYAILQNLYLTRVKTPLFSLAFFEQLYKLPSARFILVKRECEIIGGTVCVGLKNKALYEWFACGKDGEIRNVYPSTVATYSGMLFAAENGYLRFDMMGAGKPEDAYGVRDFKARFGGELVEHGRYLCISKPLLYKIGKLGVKILKRK